ncbi:MAG TPA: AbrB/MazE/SpoVT family DNA-binding domain-containing protein [Rhodanobacteraceae bacterium]
MADATVTSQGQITIPVEIRRAMNLKPGDRVRFTVLANGTTIMRAKNRSLRSLVGSLKPADGSVVPVEDMRIGRS